MSDYDPSVRVGLSEMVGRTPGLEEAYEIADKALDAMRDLNYWQEQVMISIDDTSGLESDITSSEEDACSDSEMRLVLRRSREDFYSKRPKERHAGGFRKLWTPSLSPPTSAKSLGSRRAVASSSKPSAQREKLRAPSSPRHLLHNRTPEAPLQFTNESSSSRSAGKRPLQSTPIQHLSTFDIALGGLNRSRKEPSDIVEGEM
jgi:hypothetical protein